MNILDFLNSDMNKPVAYQDLSQSWFHYLALILMVIGIVIAVTRFKKLSDQKLKKVLIIFSVVLLTLEVYKQVIFSYQANWSYQWYAFPFQFCSTPMYIALFAGLTKNKKIEEALIAFLATFGLFAGIAVMFYPVTVFISTIGINIQTMVHHGGMAVLGVGLLANKVKLESKTIIKASIVFSSLVLVAIVLNTMHLYLINEGTFNMFFISPRFENGLPILSMIQPLVHPIIFTFIYIIGFSFVAYIMLFIAIVINKMFFKEKKASFQPA
jgi:multisubunit Na+/H+ antiporter MnhC subunit